MSVLHAVRYTTRDQVNNFATFVNAESLDKATTGPCTILTIERQNAHRVHSLQRPHESRGAAGPQRHADESGRPKQSTIRVLASPKNSYTYVYYRIRA